MLLYNLYIINKYYNLGDNMVDKRKVMIVTVWAAGIVFRCHTLMYAGR